MPTFDGATKLITLDAPTGGVLDVNVQDDLYSEWKRWAQASNGANLKWNPFFRTSGGDPLTAGIKSGAYFFLQNQAGTGARIVSSDADQTVNYVGNLIGEDGATTLINVTTGRSVLHLGLQPITQQVDELLTQQQEALYQGVVAIDTANGAAGTSFPQGTRSQPVNNLADALTIAANVGLRTFELRGTITLTAALVDWTVRGVGSTDTVNLNSQDVNGTRFDHVALSGNGDGTSTVRAIDCGLSNVGGIDGEFHVCHFNGTFTLNGSSYNFVQCTSEIAGVNKPIFDFNGAAGDVSLRAYSGGLEVRNMSNAGAVMTFDAISGAPLIASSCTNGTIVLRGVGNLDDQSVGTTVVTSGWVDGTDVLLTRKILQNRVVTDPSTGTITVYDDDDTVLLTANIYEDAGGLTPYSSSSLGIDRKDRAD